MKPYRSSYVCIFILSFWTIFIKPNVQAKNFFGGPGTSFPSSGPSSFPSSRPTISPTNATFQNFPSIQLAVIGDGLFNRAAVPGYQCQYQGSVCNCYWNIGGLIGNLVHKPLNLTTFCTEGATISLILSNQVPRVLAMNPELVLLIWDSDALKDISTDGYPSQAYNHSLTQALKIIIANHITVLVTSPLLLGENEIPSFSPWSNRIKLNNYRAVTMEITTQLGAIYVDAREALLNAVDDAGYCNANAYPVCNDQGADTCGKGVVTIDGEHLNKNGAEILATLYATQLNNWFSPNYTAVDSPTKSAKCFSAFESVELESGETKFISEVSVGDRIRIVSIDGKSTMTDSFSSVIALPHPYNTDSALFHTLTTEFSSLTVTPDHLVVAGVCGSTLTLRPVSSIGAGDCLLTLSGQARIINVEQKHLRGVYTAVTLDAGALILVNGFIASPFAVNHVVTDSFYNLHRFLYWLMPSVKTPFGNLIARSLDSFTDLITYLNR